MSLTPEQRAQILYLHHVESVSVVLIAAMTGLSRHTVETVLRHTRRPEVSAEQKAAAMRPSSKGRVERQIHLARARLLREGTS